MIIITFLILFIYLFYKLVPESNGKRKFSCY